MLDEPAPLKMSFEKPPEQASERPAICGQFKRHSYGDDSRCKRCGQARPPAQLEALRQRAGGATADAGKAINEAAALRAKREQVAKVFAGFPHHAQAFVARSLYGYDGNAFDLSSDDRNTLAGCWLRIFEGFNWQPESPWYAVGELLLIEASICTRQWKQMQSDVVETTVRK